jgi:hypothetical protein
MIMRDQFAVFMRPANADGETTSICNIRGDNLTVVAESPNVEDLQDLPGFALRFLELAWGAYHVKRVARVGRVETVGWTLEGDASAPNVIRAALIGLTEEEAQTVELKFTKRESEYNINLKFSTASAKGNADEGLELGRHEILVSQSDVNNWDIRGNVTLEAAKKILARGKVHASEEIPAFLRNKLGIQLDGV